MNLTKKVIEKKYGVRLERGDFNMSDSYKSWFAYVDTTEDEEQVAWCDTLSEIVEELDSKLEEIKELKNI